MQNNNTIDKKYNLNQDKKLSFFYGVSSLNFFGSPFLFSFLNINFKYAYFGLFSCVIAQLQFLIFLIAYIYYEIPIVWLGVETFFTFSFTWGLYYAAFKILNLFLSQQNKPSS